MRHILNTYKGEKKNTVLNYENINKWKERNKKTKLLHRSHLITGPPRSSRGTNARKILSIPAVTSITWINFVVACIGATRNATSAILKRTRRET
jgi:hypothetical protein